MGVCYEIYNARSNQRFDLDKGLWFEQMPDDLDREKWRIWVMLGMGWCDESDPSDAVYVERVADAVLAFVGNALAECSVYPDHLDPPWLDAPREMWPPVVGGRHDFWQPPPAST